MAIKQYERVVWYKHTEPSEVLAKLPFWWFTDIGVSFKKNRKEEAVVYGVFPNELKPIQNPFGNFLYPTIEDTIPYDENEYPDDRSFDGFPPEEGSPFFRGLEKLLTSRNANMNDVDKINAVMRYHSMGRGEVWVIALLYERTGKKTTFGRIVFNQEFMDFLNFGGVEYLDRIFSKKRDYKLT